MTNLNNNIDNFNNFALNTEETNNVNGGAFGLSSRIRLGKNQRFGNTNNSFLDASLRGGNASFASYAAYDFSGYDAAVAEQKVEQVSVLKSEDLAPDLIIL